MNSQQIFSVIEPYRVLSDLGLTIETVGGRFVLDDPKQPGCRLIVEEQAILQTGKAPRFVAGNSVDFLAYWFDGDYGKAIDYIIQHYSELVDEQGAYPLINLRNQTVADCQFLRKQFLDLCILRTELVENPLLNSARMWCDKNNINYRKADLVMYGAFGHTLRDILGPVVCEGLDNQTQYVVFPYLSNPYTFSHLKLVNAKDDSETTLKIHPVSFSYFGLHSVIDFPGTVRVYDNPATAATMYAYSKDTGIQETGAVAVDFSASRHDNTYRLADGTLMITTATSYGQLFRYRKAFHSIYCTASDVAGNRFCLSQRITLTQHALDVFRKLFSIDLRLSPRILSMLSVLRNDKPTYEELLSYLQQRNRTDLIQNIKNHLNDNKTYEFRNMTIMETEDGYIARKGGESSMFTNFLFKLDHSLHFPDCPDIFHVGRLIFRGAEYPMVLDRKSTNRIAEIESAATAALINAGKREAQYLPVVKDSTFKATLSHVINEQASQTQSFAGISKLGWLKKTNQFITPSWQASAFGIQPTSRARHPGRFLLAKHYAFEESNFAPASAVSPQAWSAIAILTSYLTRAFLGAEQRPVLVRDDEGNRAMLKAVFKPLGQIEQLSLNPNIRVGSQAPKLDGLDGMPLFATSTNEKVFENLQLPAFCLATDGLSFGGLLNAEEYAKIANTSYAVITQVALSLLRNTHSFGPLAALAAAPANTLMREGKSFLRKLTDLTDVHVNYDRAPKFYEFVQEMGFENFDRSFQFSLADQCALINTRHTSLGRLEILKDLVKLDPSAHMATDVRHICMDVNILKGLLEEFYGHPVTIRSGKEDSANPTQETCTVHSVVTG